MPRTIRLLDDAHPEDPAFDTALSRSILLGVDGGTSPETLRIHRPGDVVAFGRQDTVSPGYHAAVAAARRQHFTPVERLAGGRAAVFHSGTIAFSWATPEPEPKEGITRRFLTLGEIMVDALRSLGVDAAIGQVPGEYCPGAYSVHARGARKVVGTGQRLTRRAAHIGGVIVVSGRDRVNDVLAPVYQALDLTWQPDATGDIESELAGVTWDRVRDAVVTTFAQRFDLVPGTADGSEHKRAWELTSDHIPA